MDVLIFILELLGTVAFAASGAMTAFRKDMDIFGAAILSLTTAVGGGVIRDLLLGITPPNTFRDPVYLVIAVAVALILFVLVRRHRLDHTSRVYDVGLFWMDALGLGAFTVTGIAVAWGASSEYHVFLVAFVGVVTGVGGGVLRDVLAGNTPYIFVKHVYACASLLGAIVCIAARIFVPQGAAMLAGMVTVVVMRVLSAHYRWNLPKAHLPKEEK